jgi:hypothetical protein
MVNDSLPSRRSDAGPDQPERRGGDDWRDEEEPEEPEPRMYEIHWKMRNDDASGHGQPLEAEVARAWLSKLQDHDDMLHWLAAVKGLGARQ